MNIELVKPSVVKVEESDYLKKIELAGRTCYKSENKITEDSAEKFVSMLCKNGHTAMCEHATIYFIIPEDRTFGPWYEILYSPYTTRNYVKDYAYLTTNFRVVLEACNNNYDAAKKLVEANQVERTEYHEPRYTFRIICDRGVTHELVRHRVFSWAQESTRYCAYNKKGFQFIQPSWWDESNQMDLRHQLFINICETSAQAYNDLISFGQTPQQARAVLPNALKAEIVMTGTKKQYEAFLKLRTVKDAHPDMQIIANMVQEQLEK